MIAGATRGSGGGALGRHVASLKGGQDVRAGASRGLVSDGILDQVAELTDIASHSRAAQPVYHVHADPPADRPLDAAGWERYWNRFEAELGLERQPFAEQIHVKAGREHRHREYSLVRPDGTTLPLAFDYQRREKIGRITEVDESQALTPGAHNRAVIAALDRDGRSDVAAAMRAAGLDAMARPRATTTPMERGQAERTGVSPASIGAAVLVAWRASDNGTAFAAALGEQGLRIERGSKVAVVVDQMGHALPLARLLAKAVKADGGGAIRAGDVSARISDLDVRRHEPPGGPRRSKEEPAEAGGESVPAAPVLAVSDPAPQPPAELAPADFHSGVLDVVQSQPAHRSHAHVQPDPGPVGPAEALVDGGSRERPQREFRSRARPAGGPQGLFDDIIRSDASGRLDAGPAAPARPAGTASGGGGGIQDRRGHLVVGEDRGKPSADGIAAGLARIESRNVELALAARPHALDRLRALAKRVANGNPAIIAARAKISDIQATRVIEALPLDRLARLLAIADRLDPLASAMAKSRERITAVCAREPWRDPASRTVREVSHSSKDAIDDAVRQASAAAEQAEVQRRQAAKRIGVLDRLAKVIGRDTSAILAERTAAADAERLRFEADRLAYSHGRRLDQADTDAPGTVRRREDERARWLESREVVAALREVHGNDLVVNAIEAGVPGVQALAARDLDTAREMLLRHEQERIEQLARATVQAKRRSSGRPDPVSSSPPSLCW